MPRITGIANRIYSVVRKTKKAGSGGGVVGSGSGNGLADDKFNLTSLLIHANGTNGVNNNTIVDDSTNSITITRNGSPAQGTYSPFSQTGWSYYNNGTASTYVTVPYTAANFAWWTTDYTIEAWIYPQDLSNWSKNTLGSGYIPNVVGNMDPSTAAYTNYWSFGIDEAGHVRLHYYNGGANYVTSIAAVNLNQWNHIGMVKTSSGISLLCNGVATNPVAVSGTPQSVDTVLSIGSYNGTAVNGYISNLRIVKGTAVYSGSSYTVPTTSLTAIANTSLLALQSNRFIDNSTNNLTHTVTLAPSIRAFTPFISADSYGASTVGGSMYFNGSTDYLNTTISSSAFTFGTDDWTVEFWTYPLAFGNMGIFQSSTVSGGMVANSGSGGIQIYFTGSATIGIAINGGWLNTATTVLNTNVWHHIALVKSSNNVKLFINGKVDSGFGTVSDTTNYTATYACVGGYYSTSYLCNAYISSLRVVKGTAGYTGNFTPPTAPLTTTQSSGTNIAAISSGTSLLLTGTNSGIYDQTSKNNLITAGSVQLSTAQYKFGTGSMYFNGSTDYITTSGTNPSLMFGTGPFTIEHWVKFTSTTSYINSMGDNSYFTTSNNFLFMWNYAGAGKLTFWINNAGVCSTTYAYNDDAWHHVAITRTAEGVVTIWVDGVADGTASGYGSTNVGTGSMIIGNQAQTSRYWSGYIDEVRISKYARYTSSFTPIAAEFGDAGIGSGNSGGAVSGITGGTKTTSGSYTVHTFTGSGSFVTDSSLSIDYLVVAGGGGSGDANGGAGGGGGGGMLTATSYSLSSGTYTITIGSGGTGSGGIGDGTNGANSSISGSGISTITAVGGGRGSAGATGGNGGSGGGGSYGSPGGTATVGQGNDGGYGALWTGGGGGGKGGAGGASGSQSFGGAGGSAASSSISGTSIYYAGGGGGGTYSGSSGSGGLGGGTATTAQKGGAGDGAKGAKGGNGTTNTGGGAGGGTDGNGGGNGGSGVVIIRYPT